MLVHHLTITQNKFFYVSNGIQCHYIHKGLNPKDAYEYGLEPILAVTLSVEGANIYHQRYFLKTDEISISAFLYDAWLNNKMLGGLPDILNVDKHLFDEYPLHNFIQQIDPYGYVKEVVTKTTPKFGASKAQAQNQIKIGLHLLGANTSIAPKSINEIFSAITECYYAFNESSIVHDNENKAQKEYINSIISRAPNLPSFTYMVSASEAQFFNGDWVTTAADAVPRLNTKESLEISGNNRFVEYLDVAYENNPENLTPYDSSSFDGSEHSRWVEDLDGIDDLIKCLDLKPIEYIPVDVSTHNFKDFLSSKMPLQIIDANKLEKNLESLPKILFPQNAKMMRGAYDYISHGGDVSRLFEVYSGELQDADYKIVFGEIYGDKLFAIVIPKGTTGYKANLKTALTNFNGRIDIGQAGMNSLIFWVEKMKDFKSTHLSGIFIEMLESMLVANKEWSSLA